MAWLRFGKRRCFTRRSKSDSRRFSIVMAILAARIALALKYDKQSYPTEPSLQDACHSGSAAFLPAGAGWFLTPFPSLTTFPTPYLVALCLHAINSRQGLPEYSTFAGRD